MSLIDSDEYTFKDMKLFFGGRIVTGFRGIKWKVSRVVSEIWASGDKPHTIVKGNKSFSGELELLQSEVEAMLESLGKGKDLTDGIFQATVCFATLSIAKIKTHQITDIHVTDFEMGMMQGDANMVVKLPFKARLITLNI
jgi:hypothetical protein